MEKLNFLIGSYIGTIKAMFRPRLWLPFLLYAILSLVVLWVFSKPFMPVLGPIVANISEFITGSERVVHYPDNYILLPMTYGWASIVLSVFVEVLLVGAAFIMFAGYYQAEPVGFGASIRDASRKYLQIFLLWLILSAIFIVLLTFVPRLFEPLIEGSRKRALVFNVGLKMSAGVVVTAMLMYVLPAILIDGERFFAAIGISIRTFFKNVISSYIIAAVPVLISLPFSSALDFPLAITTKFSPELVLYTLAGGVIANMIASFVFASTVLRFYWEYAE